jgi:hypothetical protein
MGPTTLFPNMPGDQPAAAALPQAPADPQAQRLFSGEPAHTSAPAADTMDPATAQDAEIGAEIYGPENVQVQEAIAANVPEHIRQERAERGAVFAGAADTFESRMAVAMSLDAELPAAVKQAVTAEIVRMGDDLGLQATELAEIARVSRGLADVNIPAQAGKWRQQVEAEAGRYGRHRDAVVAEARRAIRNDQRTYNALMQTGLIAHPVTNRNLLAAAARRLGLGVGK